MAGSSASSGSSSSYSNPSVIQSPESEWGMQLSQLLSSLGKNQYNWAMNQFNNGMGVTNQNIAQYMALAGKGAGLAQNLLSRYTDVFEPLMDSYIRQAGSYNSEARQKFMMGQAESTVGQADEAARSEAERKLQGFGINPNSGRYQDLMLTSRIQDAAARAGAGTQASLNTAAIGRQMTQQAAQMGQNVPGMTVNALQSAYTGITGAENALLGMLNTGTNMTSSAAPFFNAASGAIKMPPVGNTSKSQNQQRSGSMQTDPGSGGGRNAGSGAGSHPGSGDGSGAGRGAAQGPGSSADKPYTSPNTPQMKGGPWGVANRKPGEEGPELGPQLDPVKDYADRGTGEDVNPQVPSGQDPWDPQTYAGAGGSPWWADSRNPDMASGPLVGDFSGNWDGGTQRTGTTDGNQIPQPGNWNASQPVSQPDQGADPWANATNPLDQTAQADDTLNTGSIPQPQDQFNQYQQDQNPVEQGQQGNYNPQQGGWDQQTPGSTYQAGGDNGNWWDQYNQDNGIQDQSGQDQGGNWNGDWGNQSGGQDYSNQGQGQNYGQGNYNMGQYQGGNYGGSYAKGGKVGSGVLPTTGGPVSRNMSPSRGRQTDDIPARLNAGEFVVPRDVVAHKGTEFFKKLIEGSRKLRTGMGGPPARPKMKPALRLGPRFVSRGM